MADRLAKILTSLPALGIFVAICTWPVFDLNPTPGLDPSWGAGLQMAFRDGFAFGHDIVFTYGPLGFLAIPTLFYSSLGFEAVAYTMVVHATACTLLLWAATRFLNRPLAVVVAIAGCSFLGPPLVIIALIGAATIAGGRANPRLDRAYPFLAGALAAFALMVKLNIGVETLALGTIALLATEWRSALTRIAQFAAATAVSLLLLWLIAGQPLDALPDYASLSLQIVSGYSQAMALSEPGPHSYIYLAVTLILASAVGAWALNSDLERRRRVAFTALITLFGFLSFKEGFIRQDDGHIALFTSAMVSTWFVLGWRSPLRWPGVIGLAGLLSIALYFQPGSIDPLSRISTAREQLSTVLIRAHRLDAIEAGRVEVSAYNAIDPAMVSRIGEGTVHVSPYEASAVWALGLNWKPLPVFQDYLAFTSTLDRENADALRSKDGPEFILRRHDMSAIDDRYAGFDPPEASVAMLCNYRPLLTRDPWLLLGKAADRCGKMRFLGRVPRPFGVPVPVPRGPEGSLVIARIHGAEVAGTEKVRALLFRARPRFITLFDTRRPATDRSFRLVPATARDGLLISAPAGADYPGHFALAPNAKAFSVGGPDLNGSIDVEFLAIPIEAHGQAESRKLGSGPSRQEPAATR